MVRIYNELTWRFVIIGQYVSKAILFDESKGSQYHLHIHLIPRTEKVGAGESGKGKPSQSAAWNTPKLACKDWFPQEYRIRDKTGKEEVVALMTCLKLHLEK